MAVKFLITTLVSFGLIGGVILVKQPYEIDELGKDGALIPEIELFETKHFHLSIEGITALIESQRVARYGMKDYLWGIDAKHQTQEGLQGTLHSPEALLHEGILHFPKEAHYARSDGIALEGTSIFYELDNELLRSNEPFTFWQKQSVANGDSFVYQMKEGTIRAQNIHATIATQKSLGHN